MEDENAMKNAIQTLAEKYHPTDSAQGREEAIMREWKPLCLIQFDIEHMTGKEAIELVRARRE